MSTKIARAAMLLRYVAALVVLTAASNVVATEGMHFDDSGREQPWTNCTLCHGADLLGSAGPACTDCHDDFAEPDPPPTGHHFPGREDPFANNCTLCHGDELQGDQQADRPSCFDCHDEVWGGGGGNSPPVIDGGGPYTGVVDQAVNFDASGTTDADGDELMYFWSFGDGSQPSFPSISPTTSHIYESTGTYTVLLSVTDTVNLPEIVEVQVVIGDGTANLPPVVDPGGPYSGIAGQGVQFNGSGTTDPEDDTLTYEWDFGDGSPTQSSQLATMSHTFASAGTFTVTLSVSDGFNSPVSEEVEIEIAPPNVPPVADAGGPYSGAPGASIALSAAGSFDADNDTLEYQWDFGDGSPLETSSSATINHTYAGVGTYTAVLTVSDGVNNPVTDNASVQVSDGSVPPPPPPGSDSWSIRLPLIPLEGTLTLDRFAGFLFTKTTFTDSLPVYGIGMRSGGFIFWMDSSGALYFGTVRENGMVGLVFNMMGRSDSIWFAEDMSAGQSSGPEEIFGSYFGQFF